MLYKKAIVVLFFMLVITFSNAFTQEYIYPIIKSLSSKDMVFKQLSDSLTQSYVAENNAGKYPDLFFCVYKTQKNDDFLSICARLMLPIETVATLNGFSSSKAFLPGSMLYIPSITGVFVPTVPENDLDYIMQARLEEDNKKSYLISIIKDGKKHEYVFFPGSRFEQTERSFFLNIGFRIPIDKGHVSSSYGKRKSPFGNYEHFHKGIDIAAPLGTAVYASRGGVIKTLSNDGDLGLHIIIQHDGGFTSVYGHLSKTVVVLNQKVSRGTIIGEVGSTGLSTGPHLHFEIRMSGDTKDPSNFVPGLK